MRNLYRIRSQYRAGRVLNGTFMKPWAKYAFFIIPIDFVLATADGSKSQRNARPEKQVLFYKQYHHKHLSNFINNI